MNQNIQLRRGAVYDDWVGNHSDSRYTTLLTQSISGSKNPNWRIAIDKGQDATSSYSRSGYTNAVFPYYGAKARYVNDPPESWFSNFGYHENVITGYDSVDPNLDQQCLHSFRGKIDRSQGNFKAIAPLVELREMRGLISFAANASFTMLQGMVELKRGKFRDASKRAADLWLGFNFGISPTLNDIAAANQSIRHYLDRDGAPMDISSTRYRESLNNEYVSTASTVGGHNFTFKSRYTYSESIKYACKYYPAISAANNYGITDHLGISLPELIPAFWELVPYSWAIDYFTNAGDFFSDAFSAPSGESRFMYKNRIAKSISKISVEGVPMSASVLPMGLTTSSGIFEYFSFSRSPISALPFPSFRFKTVDEIGYHGVTKVLNLAAVLAK